VGVEMEAVKAENLRVTYRGYVAISDVTFSLEEGTTLLLLGPNGAGKTTLLKVVAGIHREYTGRVLVFGKEPWQAREYISYVPQSHTLNEGVPLTALDVVAMGALYRSGLIHRKIPEGIEEKGMKALEFVGLPGIQDKLFRNLSGGQKQRVLLARALISEPKLLLLDEPLSALDPSARAEVTGVLRKIKEKRGLTMIITTHDINPLLEIGDRVMLINKRMIAFGRPDEALKDEIIKAVYGPMARAIKVEDKLYCITGDFHVFKRRGGW